MQLKSINQWNLKLTDGILYDINNNIKPQNLDSVDFSKPGILIIDDNEGICSFILDDFEELAESGDINLDDYNVFCFHGIMCAYDLISTIQKYDNFNIQKALIDITYTGTIETNNGNIKLNGVDVFEILYELNKNLKFIFYTGNQMNTHIKLIGYIKDKFNRITSKCIDDFIMFKTEYSMKERRQVIKKTLF